MLGTDALREGARGLRYWRAIALNEVGRLPHDGKFVGIQDAGPKTGFAVAIAEAVEVP
jgi:hypothetical protein